MNTYYHNHSTESGADFPATTIMYPTHTVSNFSRLCGGAKRLFSGLARFLVLLGTLFGKMTFRRVLRIFVIAICFFAFIGVIGGVESGVLSLGAGILISAFLLFAEILCLRG